MSKPFDHFDKQKTPIGAEYNHKKGPAKLKADP